MKSAKAASLDHALHEIFQLLSQYGEVTVSAKVGGRTVQISLAEGDGAPSAARVAGRPAKGAKAAQAAADAPDSGSVYAAIEAVPLGLTLEDLATKLGVRPRNLLKPVIQALVREGRVKKVGRRHRATSAVVRRGPPPKAARDAKPAPKPGRKKAVSPAKLAALEKARAARAAKRAAAAGGKKPAAPVAKGKPGRPPKAAKAAAAPKAAKAAKAPAKKADAAKPERNKALGVSETKLSALAKAREALARARAERSAKAAKGKAKPAKGGKLMGTRAGQRRNAQTDAAAPVDSAATDTKTPGVEDEQAG